MRMQLDDTNLILLDKFIIKNMLLTLDNNFINRKKISNLKMIISCFYIQRK